jgi:hypothetical protein
MDDLWVFLWSCLVGMLGALGAMSWLLHHHPVLLHSPKKRLPVSTGLASSESNDSKSDPRLTATHIAHRGSRLEGKVLSCHAYGSLC